jgi:transmembrane sensor
MMGPTIQELFKKYLDETITQEEFVRLYQLINDGYDPGELDPLLEAAWSERRYAAPGNDSDRREVLANLLNRIKVRDLYPEQSEMIDTEQAVRYGRSRRSWYRPGWVRYAAAIIVLLASGAWLLFNNRHSAGSAPVAVARPASDITAPKGARTTLTLSSGQQIILDSVGSGTLTVQGGTSVRKLKNGQLAYESGKKNPDNILYNTLSTAKGGQTMVVLADGSKVWLNALSSLRYPTAFAGKERTVELDGEAYFEISSNKDKPFRVNIQGRGEVVVLGTHFNVNAYRDEPTINTTLLEGSVKVKREGTEFVTIKPGQQVQMNDKRMTVEGDADIEEVMAWKNGYFSFDGANTEEIMRQVSRWYDVKIIYEGNIKEERFAGSMPRSANASKLLEVLSLTKTVQFVIQDKTIIVKPFHS